MSSDGNERLVIEISAILLGTLFVAAGILFPVDVSDPKVKAIVVSLYLGTGAFSLAGLLAWGTLRRVDGPVTNELRNLSYIFFSLGWLATFASLSGIFALKIRLEELQALAPIVAVSLGLFFILIVSVGFLAALIRVAVRKSWKKLRNKWKSNRAERQSPVICVSNPCVIVGSTPVGEWPYLRQ
mgnify:CR=1 FL=1